ncbi:hypothetical protein CHUAL_012104 [Chamberlinius hualienensis]
MNTPSVYPYAKQTTPYPTGNYYVPKEQTTTTTTYKPVVTPPSYVKKYKRDIFEDSVMATSRPTQRPFLTHFPINQRPFDQNPAFTRPTTQKFNLNPIEGDSFRRPTPTGMTFGPFQTSTEMPTGRPVFNFGPTTERQVNRFNFQ